MQTNYTPCHMNCSNPPSIETNLVKAYMAQSTKTPVLHWHNDQLAHEHSCLPPVAQTQKSCLSRSNSQRRANNNWVNDFVSVSSNNQSCTLSRSSSQRRSPVAWRPASPTTIQRSPTNRLSRSQSLRRSPNAWSVYSMDGTVNQTSQRTFFSESRQQHYEEKFNSTRILGRCCLCDAGVNPHNHFTLNGKDYHFDCLNCTVCGCRLGQYSFKELGGHIYCARDYAIAVGGSMVPVLQTSPSLNAARSHSPHRLQSHDTHCCETCRGKVYATEMLRVMNKVYHKSCFKCSVCYGTLGVENYHVHEGLPYCKAHFKQLSTN